MGTRLCKTCGEHKSSTAEFFYLRDGQARGKCKECAKLAAIVRHNINRDSNLARMAVYRDANREKLRAAAYARMVEKREEINQGQRDRYQANKIQRASEMRARRAADPEHARAIDKKRRGTERYKAQVRQRAAENREEFAERAREYRAKNPERSRGYDAKRYSQPKFRITRAINAHVSRHLVRVGSSKTSQRRMITGWSVAELVAHLEALFEPGMTLENWGEWQIDHIIPVARVDFEDEDDAAFKAVWALSNLAPLWAFDNNQKHDRLDWKLPHTYVNPKLRAMYDTPSCAYLVAA